MRITERRLRQIIRNVIKESAVLEGDLNVDPKLVVFFQDQISKSSYDLTEGESPKQIAIALALFFTVLAGGLKVTTMLDQAEKAELTKTMNTIEKVVEDRTCTLDGDSKVPGSNKTIDEFLSRVESQYTGKIGHPRHRRTVKGPLAIKAAKLAKKLKQNCVR